VVAAPVIEAPVTEVAPAVDPVVAVTSLVEQWASAWSSKDFAAYGSFYGDQFKTTQQRSKAAWLSFRKPRILGRQAIAVSVEDLQVKVLEAGAAEVTFVQNYESGKVKDRSVKKMNVVQTAGGWRIVSEESQPMPKPMPVKLEEPVKVEAPEASTVTDPTMEVSALLQQWATAWSSKDFDAYAGFYGDGFKTPQFRSKSAWLKFRQPRVMGNEDIQVTVEDVSVDAMNGAKINIVFVQRYTSRALKIRSVKKMVMQNTAEGWKIVSERD
jgi:ketosteroid isomerase-like protein